MYLQVSLVLSRKMPEMKLRLRPFFGLSAMEPRFMDSVTSGKNSLLFRVFWAFTLTAVFSGKFGMLRLLRKVFSSFPWAIFVEWVHYYKNNYRMECIHEANARHKVIIFCTSRPCNYQLDNNEIKQSNKETNQHDKWPAWLQGSMTHHSGGVFCQTFPLIATINMKFSTHCALVSCSF